MRKARCEIDEYCVNVVLFMLKSMYFNAPVRLLHIIICSYAFCFPLGFIVGLIMLGSIIVKRFGLYTYRCTCNARGHIQNIKYAQSRDCFILQDVSVERAQCMRWSFVQHARNTCCIRREVYYMRSVYGMPALCMRQVYAQRVGNTLCIRCKLAEASPKFWQELDARRRTDQFSVFWLNFQRAGHASAMCDHRFTGRQLPLKNDIEKMKLI